jgi:hypothetical protein
MNRLPLCEAILCLWLGVFISSCDRDARAKDDQSPDTGPRATAVVQDLDAGNFKVDHPNSSLA